MKTVIASSGLSHIKRGMEGWSADIARGLYEKGIDVTLFKGSGIVEHDYEVVLSTFKRHGSIAKTLGFMTSKGGWRIGLGTPASVESFVFGLKLLKQLKQDYDLIHVKQAGLAAFLMRAKSLGIHNVPVILSNGQIADEKFLSTIDYVQHLTPCRERITCDENDWDDLPENRFVIPNFIDTHMFSPGDKILSRDKLGLPKESIIILTVGTIKKYHKRMDYFINEMARLMKTCTVPIHFVMAGATDPETKDIITLGNERLGNRFTVLKDLPRERMPDLYAASDIFVLCSLLEAFGTVIIEAMACHLPVICHNHGSFRWIVKECGITIDMKKEDELAETIKPFIYDTQLRLEKGSMGRERVLDEFSSEVVVSKIIKMYNSIISK